MRKRTLSAVVAACILGLGACATPHPEEGLTGGVTATQLTADTFQIVATGNGYTNTATIERHALRKAAEVTVANGYDLFVIAPAADQGRVSGVVSNAQFDSAGGHSTGVATSIFTPGQTMLVKMFKGPMPTREMALPNLYDAREILRYPAPAQPQ